MSVDEQRIFVAEWMGMDVKLCPTHHSRECCGRTRIPPLTLDWLHECEGKITDKRRQDIYCTKLASIVNTIKDWNMQRMKVVAWPTIRATKEQRLAALVATIKAV